MLQGQRQEWVGPSSSLDNSEVTLRGSLESEGSNALPSSVFGMCLGGRGGRVRTGGEAAAGPRTMEGQPGNPLTDLRKELSGVERRPLGQAR